MPDIALPKPPDPKLDPAAYLRSIHAVRERSQVIFKKALKDKLEHFDVDMSSFRKTAEYVVAMIKVGSCASAKIRHQRDVMLTNILQRDYAPDFHLIPPHGRWQHFEAGGRPRIDNLLATWPLSVDNQERTRRLIDLFLVSVLLDAGAGTAWSYKSKESGKIYRRSEGLAVASFEMFKIGMFSSNPDQPFQVDALGLAQLNEATLGRGLQVSPTNPIAGLEGRAGLMTRLSQALRNQEFFGKTTRPGNMLGMRWKLVFGIRND